MTNAMKRTLALPFEPGQVMALFGMRPVGALTETPYLRVDQAVAVIKRYPESTEL